MTLGMVTSANTNTMTAQVAVRLLRHSRATVSALLLIDAHSQNGEEEVVSGGVPSGDIGHGGSRDDRTGVDDQQMIRHLGEVVHQMRRDEYAARMPAEALTQQR